MVIFWNLLLEVCVQWVLPTPDTVVRHYTFVTCWYTNLRRITISLYQLILYHVIVTLHDVASCHVTFVAVFSCIYLPLLPQHEDHCFQLIRIIWELLLAPFPSFDHLKHRSSVRNRLRHFKNAPSAVSKNRYVRYTRKNVAQGVGNRNDSRNHRKRRNSTQLITETIWWRNSEQKVNDYRY